MRLLWGPLPVADVHGVAVGEGREGAELGVVLVRALFETDRSRGLGRPEGTHVQVLRGTTNARVPGWRPISRQTGDRLLAVRPTALRDQGRGQGLARKSQHRGIMRTLASMIGEVIIARIPLLDAEGMELVKLHGVEAHGIWIESQQFTDRLMERFHLSSSRTTPLVFIPFDKVDFIIGAMDSLSLSEQAFGL